MFARFDENPAMTLQVIKKTKRYAHTDACTDNVKTVYPTTNKVCGGYKYTANNFSRRHFQMCFAGPSMGNSADADQMSPGVALHLGLHC